EASTRRSHPTGPPDYPNPHWVRLVRSRIGFGWKAGGSRRFSNTHAEGRARARSDRGRARGPEAVSRWTSSGEGARSFRGSIGLAAPPETGQGRHLDRLARRPAGAVALDPVIERVALDGDPAGLGDQAADLRDRHFLRRLRARLVVDL